MSGAREAGEDGKTSETVPRTIVVIGATSGIGRACALRLADAGHRLILVGRDRRRGAELAKQTGAVFVGGDVSTRAGIEAVAAGVQAETDSIDTLVNNAGVMIPRRTLTDEGLELNFAVHHLAPFTTTSLLMPLLARGAGRVVNTNSEGHRAPLFGGGDVRLDFDDLQSAHGYSPYLAYSRSKLANLLFTAEFHRRQPAFQTVAVHPGMVRTRLVRSMHSPGFWLLSTATRWMLASPARGGRPLADLATAPAIHNGGYYNGSRPSTPSPHAASRADAEQLWQVTEKLRGPFVAA
ncbi:retinol dehydrogenase-12 [Catenulispora sp. GP43]|uniref:SDR family NAD(P)-dependent oxidoreductase n=1 Tax=Catenulispora sp. GP43 TaxID=3156263 RepID=UPI0035181750